MWAYLDDSTADVLAGTWPPPKQLTRHYRGSTALDPWVQAAERAVAIRLGKAWVEWTLAEARWTAPAEDRWEVNLHWHGQNGNAQTTAIVTTTRIVPTPVCGQPIEASTKTSREYDVESLDLDDSMVAT